VIPDAVGVDLGDHQRHVRIHAESGRIIDNDGAGLHRDGRKLPGNATARREQRDIDAFERVFVKLFDHDFLAAEVDRLACRPRARQRFELADAKCALVHGGDEFGADSAGHAGNGNNGIVLHFGLHQAIKKAPNLVRRGFGSDDAIVRLRAHASRGPRGLCGFGGAFGGRDHGAGIYAGDFDRRQRLSGQKIGFNEVEQDAIVTQ
jgi:hypothetical protein